jgi:hypothetical protein
MPQLSKTPGQPGVEIDASAPKLEINCSDVDLDAEAFA